MSEVFLEYDELISRFLSEEDFYLNNDDLEHISCNGKQCDPVTCLRTSCKVHQYWRGKKDD